MTTLPASAACGRSPRALSGTVTTTTSPARAASCEPAARACGPSSPTRSASVSGPRLLLRTTSWPASTASRATVLPMFPLPMKPQVVMRAPTRWEADPIPPGQVSLLSTGADLLDRRHDGDHHRTHDEADDGRGEGVDAPAERPTADGLLGVVHPVVEGVPAELVDPHEQDVAADPEHRDDADRRQCRQQLGHPGDQAPADGAGGTGLAPREVQADVVHLHDEADHAVHQHGDA